MPAPLRIYLVLQMKAGYPAVLEDGDRASGTHRLAKARVGVDQGGKVGNRRDLPAPGRHLGEGGQPDIGQGQIRRQHRARYVDTFEADFLNQLGHQRGEGAGEAQQFTGR
ncbi:Uncharacterised protein [Mycobacteroides abscessus]|nr:Uncharacterised protein [Mycobacteroides abscessus]